MPIDEHYEYCRCAECWSPERRAAYAEERLLARMTFHRRKPTALPNGRPPMPEPTTIPEITDWCPVYEKDGNEFVILAPDFRADDEETAHRIGLGSMLVECVVWQMKFARVQGVNAKHLPHRAAEIQGCPVAIIAGPYFEEVAHA